MSYFVGIAVVVMVVLYIYQNRFMLRKQKKEKQELDNRPKGFRNFFNFENIGAKIKNFTILYSWITIVLIWVGSVICIIAGLAEESYLLVGIAIGMAVIMPFIIWISSWMLYAFGELVESNMEMRDNTKKQLNEINKNISKIANASHQDNTPKT